MKKIMSYRATVINEYDITMEKENISDKKEIIQRRLK